MKSPKRLLFLLLFFPTIIFSQWENITFKETNPVNAFKIKESIKLKDGMLLYGSGAAEILNRGLIMKVDFEGKVVWKFYPQSCTNEGYKNSYTGGIIYQVAIDAEAQFIYLLVREEYIINKEPLNLLKLDIASGELIWRIETPVANVEHLLVNQKNEVVIYQKDLHFIDASQKKDILHYDTNGQLLGSYPINGLPVVTSTSFVQTRDGYYYLMTADQLIKLDKEQPNTIIWSLHNETALDQIIIFDLLQAPNDKLYLVGIGEKQNSSGKMVEINPSDGSVLWSHTFPKLSIDGLNNYFFDDDNLYLAWFYSVASRGFTTLIHKFDTDNNTFLWESGSLWAAIDPFSNVAPLGSIGINDIEKVDGAIYITGYYGASRKNEGNLGLMKIDDENGSKIWENTIWGNIGGYALDASGHILHLQTDKLSVWGNVQRESDGIGLPQFYRYDVSLVDGEFIDSLAYPSDFRLTSRALDIVPMPDGTLSVLQQEGRQLAVANYTQNAQLNWKTILEHPTDIAQGIQLKVNEKGALGILSNPVVWDGGIGSWQNAPNWIYITLLDSSGKQVNQFGHLPSTYNSFNFPPFSHRIYHEATGLYPIGEEWHLTQRNFVEVYNESLGSVRAFPGEQRTFWNRLNNNQIMTRYKEGWVHIKETLPAGTIGYLDPTAHRSEVLDSLPTRFRSYDMTDVRNNRFAFIGEMSGFTYAGIYNLEGDSLDHWILVTEYNHTMERILWEQDALYIAGYTSFYQQQPDVEVYKVDLAVDTVVWKYEMGKPNFNDYPIDIIFDPEEESLYIGIEQKFIDSAPHQWQFAEVHKLDGKNGQLQNILKVDNNFPCHFNASSVIGDFHELDNGSFLYSGGLVNTTDKNAGFITLLKDAAKTNIWRGEVRSSKNFGMENTLLQLQERNQSVVSTNAISQFDGYFKIAFDQNSETDYLLKAIPSVVNINEVPTYLGGGVTQDKAQILTTNKAFQQVFLQTKQLHQIADGINSLTGSLTDEMASPLVEIPLFLLDEIGEVYGYTVTDELGQFEFQNLPDKKLQLVADYPLVNNDLSPKISFTEHNSLTNQQFQIKTNQLIWLNTTNVEDTPSSTPTIIIFPNPVKQELYLSNLPSNSTITLFSLTGKNLLRQKVNLENYSLSIKNLSNGTYILSVENEKKQFIFSKTIIKTP